MSQSAPHQGLRALREPGLAHRECIYSNDAFTKKSVTFEYDWRHPTPPLLNGAKFRGAERPNSLSVSIS